MKQAITAFEEIRYQQSYLSRKKLSNNQEKKFKQFKTNFEDVSDEFYKMLKEYKKATEELNEKDFGDSDFKYNKIICKD